ncbi:MAG: hypothetical protein ACKVT2_01365 [Saprospiraceae bacterium]
MAIPIRVLFRPEFCTAFLLIDDKHIDLDVKRVQAERLGLYEKEEFHITIIGTETGEEILQQLDGLQEEAKMLGLGKLQFLCTAFQWKVKLLNEYYYIKKFYSENKELESITNKLEKRETIIQMARIENFTTFFKNLNQLFDTKFETSIPHVTLFANSNIEAKRLRGIGIYSKKQFLKLAPVRL